MRRRNVAILVVGMGLLASAGLAADLQMFDAAVLGKATSEPVRLLRAKADATEIEPFVVWTDVRCGRYVAATAFYRKPATIEWARETLKRVYAAGARDVTADTWRLESLRLAISLKDNRDGTFSVFFLHFAPRAEIAKNIMTAQGLAAAAEAFEGASCAEWEEVLGNVEPR